MKKINPSLPKGTKDFGTVEMRKRNYLFDVFKELFNVFGFNSIQTPSMENMDILNGKYGDEGDKLIFRVLNSGNFIDGVNKIDSFKINELKNKISKKGLRYDLTVPLARYVSMNRDKITLPFKRYQIQPVWRADRPQRGRFREFVQCDVDYIGTRSVVCEAEILELVNEFFGRIKYKDFDIRLNNRKILQGISEVLKFENKFEEFCILIDKIDKIGIDKFKEELKKKRFTPKTIEQIDIVFQIKGDNETKIQFLEKYLKNSIIGTDGLNEIKSLSKYNNNFIFELKLARGLSYYTSTIFEVIPKNNKIGSLCGGGRYDNLTEIFGYKNISGIGISFGIERIIDIMDNENLFPNKLSDSTVLVAYLGSEFILDSIKISQFLRKNNVNVDLYSDNNKLKKQLQYANNNKIPYVIIVGEEEIESKEYTLKNMNTGKQEKLNLKKILDRVSQ